MSPERDETASHAILRLLAEAGPGRTISPTDAAREIVPGTEWHLAMPQIRRAAIALAVEGRLVILRKGRPADPHDFKGVYRLALPRQD